MAQTIDIQGHRGCRGLYPENTIEGFIAALDLKVQTLEMDVTVSKDLKVIVSHEPYFNHEFCLKPDGSELLKSEEKNFKLGQLTAAEIATFDSGTKYYPKFPKQKKIKTKKPMLDEVVDAVAQHIGAADKILYNIEIKRKPKWDSIYTPAYKLFADTVMKTIIKLGIAEVTTVQCFDVPTLQYLHKNYPNQPLVYLISNFKSPKKNLKRLGFTPAVYSPDFRLVKKKTVKYCQKKGMKLIPWTVNKNKDILKMQALGVDGIISDYPNRVVKLLQ